MGNSCKVFIRSFSIIIIALLLSVKASPISHIKHHNGTVYNYWTTKAWGANLGNWLILEKWMDSSIFDKYAPKAVDEWTFCQHATNPAKALEEHWNSWVREDDFKILASVHANHVRIPVGYWAFITPDSGEPYVSSGQKKQIERILQYCNTYNMYAIIDLHGLPGSQNGEAHSGHIGPIQFYSDYNIERSIKTIRAIVDWMNGLDYVLKSRIASIQSANEPRIVKDNQLNILKKYYNDAFHIIDASPYKVPMIFHDAFQGLSAWNDFLPVPANAVIDLHSYFAFPPVLFGEWSLASGVPNSDSWLKEMMDTQVAIYKTGGAGGTFWALKNNINSSVWSFEQLVNEGIINATTYLYHTNAQC